MSTDILRQLKKTLIFSGLSDDALAEVAQKATTRRLSKNDVLMKKGEVGDSLFLIHQGWVKIVTVDSKGDELIINKCGPGETIGEMALLDQGRRSATVIALEDAQVLELKNDVFEKILNQRPDVSLSIIRSYSDRLRFSTTYIERAIDWAQKIAEGDYSFVDQTQPTNQTASDDDKATQLLSAFFTMVNRVKEREDGLKQQLEKLSFEIDQARRKQEFEEITSTEFYAQLKEQAKALRQKRHQD
ncbi:MAG: cyclic nucleotide-binding domain-containing protein [Anaerolineales bacterium]|jgi:CRP-like cAMP-binding protein|nr:cyclic nucleotide-binding domain-containing protein [Anaerolineales bacterium]